MNEPQAYRKAIEMQNGIPVPVFKPTVTADSVKRGQLEALAEPYAWQEGDPEEWKWMTKVQVGQQHQANEVAKGNLDELNRVYDRILGKPKQAIEQVSVNMTLQQWLGMLADKDEADEQQNQDTTIDVTASQVYQSTPTPHQEHLQAAIETINRLGL